MGFGILMIGYFLILNITYYEATDLIAGIIMLMAFYKLRTVNKYFSFAILPAALFAAVGIPELVAITASFFARDLSAILTYTAAPRCLLLCILSILMMKGIHKVSEEVEVYKTAKNAKNVQPFIYLVLAVCSFWSFHSHLVTRLNGYTLQDLYSCLAALRLRFTALR